MIDPGPVLFGLLVGFLVGLTGVGGGSLMTPFLVAVMGVPAPTAVGTDLTFATLTKLTGSFQHFRQRSVNVEIAVFLGMGSIPAGLLGVGTLEWIKGSFDPARVESIMLTIIAATLVLVGMSLIYRDYFMPKRHEGPKPGRWDGKSRMSRRRRAYTVLFGALGGYLVGVVMIGVDPGSFWSQMQAAVDLRNDGSGELRVAVAAAAEADLAGAVKDVEGLLNRNRIFVDRTQGIGVQFTLDETGAAAKATIERILGEHLGSTRSTHTM